MVVIVRPALTVENGGLKRFDGIFFCLFEIRLSEKTIKI